MDSYKFVGTVSNIGDVRLEELGQVIHLSRDDAANAINGGASLVPASAFDSVGFTEEEMRIYKYPGMRASAPDSFWSKLRSAIGLIGVAPEVEV